MLVDFNLAYNPSCAYNDGWSCPITPPENRLRVAIRADEFIVAGVVQEIAADLRVTLGAVGLFESAYAIGVAIGAPLFVAIGSRVPRPQMLLATATTWPTARRRTITRMLLKNIARDR